MDKEFCHVEQKHIKVKKEINIVENFHQEVEKGPNYICTSCDQMWYKNGVVTASRGCFKDETFMNKILTGVKSFHGKEWICLTCLNAVKKTKLPALSKANEIKFPLKPFELDLTNLEERLVAPRIPFMQLHELPRGGQTSLTGNIVNIPTNVNNTVSILPRKVDDAACIPLKLKRRMNLDRHYLYQNVRPNKVIDAVKWLVKESDLYKEEGIKINTKWQYDDMGNNEQQLSSNSSVSADTLNDPLSDAEWDETKEKDIPVGTLDTMLQSADLAEESKTLYL